MNKITDSNIDKYKDDREIEHHWDLRKKFILAHKDKYPEERLICLSKVFCNVKFLGCTYSDNVMKLVDELSKNIQSDKGTEQRSHQRILTDASTAFNQKVRREGYLPGLQKQTGFKPILFQKSNTLTLSDESDFVRKPDDLTSDNKDSASQNKSDLERQSDVFVSNRTGFGGSLIDKIKSNLTGSKPDDVCQNKAATSKTDSQQDTCCSITELMDKFSELKNLVLLSKANYNFLDHGNVIIDKTFSRFLPALVYSVTSENQMWKCVITYKDFVVSTALSESKVASRKNSIYNFLSELHKVCYTVVEKTEFISDRPIIGKNEDKEENETNLDHNIGNKMLKKMGWKGGGLGAQEQGIAEPLPTNCEQIHRRGFGSNLNKGQFVKCLKAKLQQYIIENSKYDLIFSTDFDKEERVMIHKLAQSMGLKSKSYGPVNQRQLVVSIKRLNDPQLLVRQLINCGGEDERYVLISPESSSFSRDIRF